MLTSLAVAGIVILAVTVICVLIGLGLSVASSNESVYGPFCGFWMSMYVWDAIFRLIGAVLEVSIQLIGELMTSGSE